MNSILQTVRNDNMWPQHHLEDFHPHNNDSSYDGQQQKAITPVHIFMGVFMTADSSDMKLSEFVELCGVAPLHSWVTDLGQAVADYWGGMKSDGTIMTPDNLLDYHAMLMNTATGACKRARFLQKEMDVARPDYVKHPEYKDQPGGIDEFSYVIGRVMLAANVYFGSKKPVLMYDTAYLLAMLPAMAGLNSPEACVEGLVRSELPWE